MLIPQGEIVYKNLHTAFTNIDQLINELETHKITGYCLMRFATYEGVVLFDSQDILNGIEKTGDAATSPLRTGEEAVTDFLAKAREKGREISVYRLPEETVIMLAAALEGNIIYHNLTTELTSLDKLLPALQKESLSGYIEILIDADAGAANVFLTDGELIVSLFAPSRSAIIASPKPTNEIIELCKTKQAIFNVYQANYASVTPSQRPGQFKEAVPQRVVTLFEQILNCLEYAVDPVSQEGTFEKILKALLPQLANQYDFFDPFLGEFQYKNKSLTYTGEATFKEFVDGVCALINATLPALFQTISQHTLLPRISQRVESVSLAFSELIDQLHLRTRMPEIFQDYAFLKEAGLDDASQKKRADNQLVLNLRGADKSITLLDEILQEFYATITAIHETYCDQTGKKMHYKALKGSREFQAYKATTALLQKCDFSALPDRDQRLAFWMNVYNFLVIDGVLEFGVKTDVRTVKGFFTKTCYLIGKQVFSLDDIEHGILRNNHRHPYTLFRQFKSTDPRKAFCIDPLENRIHFCLVSAAMSSPPLAVYLPEDLEGQLTSITDYFLTTQGMRLDLEKQELWLARVFYWYRKDFEEQGQALIDFVLSAIRNEALKQQIQQHKTTLKLRFMDYDWSLNGE